MARQIGLADVTTALGFTPLDANAGLSGANLSSATAVAAGSTTPRSLAAWLGDMANAKAFGIKGDGINLNGVVTIATGSLNVLTISNGAFTYSDVGKLFYIDVFGPNGTTLASVSSVITAVNSPTQIALRDNVVACTSTSCPIYYGTDDSAAINAAAQTGVRTLVFPTGLYLAPSLDDVLTRNCIFIGIDAHLVKRPGASRKIIVDITAPGPAPVNSGVIPEIHLSNLVGKTSATIVFVGDSHGVYSSGAEQGMIAMLMVKFITEFPAIAFKFLNYSIGGTNFNHLNMLNSDFTPGWVPNPYPAWWTPTTNTWLQMIQAAAPDVVVPIRLTNEINILPSALISSVNTFANTLNSWAKKPNVLFVLEPGRSLFPDVTSVNSEEKVAMFLRTFAMTHGWGLVDNHRLGCQVREGFDPLAGQGYTLQDRADSTVVLPYTLPGPTRDYGAFCTAFGTTGQPALAQYNNEIQFTLSDNPGDSFYVGCDTATNCVYYGAKCGGLDTIPKTVTTVPCVYHPTGGGTFTLIFMLYGPTVTVVTGDGSEPATIFSGPVNRFGYKLTPVITCSQPTGIVLLRSNFMNKSVPRPTMPELTDYELFGVTTPPSPPTVDYFGGNSNVHYGSRGLVNIVKRNLDALRFGPATDAAGNLRGSGLYLFGLPGAPSYASDAAAATGGVAIGQTYRNGSALMIRVT